MAMSQWAMGCQTHASDLQIVREVLTDCTADQQHPYSQVLRIEAPQPGENGIAMPQPLVWIAVPLL